MLNYLVTVFGSIYETLLNLCLHCFFPVSSYRPNVRQSKAENASAIKKSSLMKNKHRVKVQSPPSKKRNLQNGPRSHNQVKQRYHAQIRKNKNLENRQGQNM